MSTSPSSGPVKSTSRFSLPPVGLWTGALDMVPAQRARHLAAELECLGYGAIWVPEVAGRDPFVHLALLLSATDRIVCATGIASIWARDAVTTSCSAKTLTEAFPERVVVGLGASHANLVRDLRGHDYDKPLTAMRAYLDGMERSPYTAYRPETPVRYVLAALRRRILALAGERTTGAHPYFVTPDHTLRARDILGPVSTGWVTPGSVAGFGSSPRPSPCRSRSPQGHVPGCRSQDCQPYGDERSAAASSAPASGAADRG